MEVYGGEQERPRRNLVALRTVADRVPLLQEGIAKLKRVLEGDKTEVRRVMISPAHILFRKPALV